MDVSRPKTRAISQLFQIDCLFYNIFFLNINISTKITIFSPSSQKAQIGSIPLITSRISLFLRFFSFRSDEIIIALEGDKIISKKNVSLSF